MHSLLPLPFLSTAQRRRHWSEFSQAKEGPGPTSPMACLSSLTGQLAYMRAHHPSLLCFQRMDARDLELSVCKGSTLCIPVYSAIPTGWLLNLDHPLHCILAVWASVPKTQGQSHSVNHPEQTCKNAYFPVVPWTFILRLHTLSSWRALAL